jgi:hypothetical protein
VWAELAENGGLFDYDGLHGADGEDAVGKFK